MPRSKIPTKAELIRLQKLYKTDEKIAERLGNVTPQLVAYWRRKKNIARHSFPKFSIEEIRDLWERYGDDYRCGLDLGISKAAFYNWRRKYGIKHKPAFLKLEQLELDLGAMSQSVKRPSEDRQTIAQKILAERVNEKKVEVGETIQVEPDLAMIDHSASEIIELFRKSNLAYVWNPNRIVISLDADFNSIGSVKAEAFKQIREFVKSQNIKYFYDIDNGGCHQLVVENGRILPGQLAVSNLGSCSAYGSVSALALKIDNDEMANLWSTRTVSIRVPSTIKVDINGKLPIGAFAKDVLLFVAKNLSDEKVEGRIIEYGGSSISAMSVSERFTMTSMAACIGATSAICAFDSITRRYLIRRSKMPFRPALADKNADYVNSYEFNVDQLLPQIAKSGDKTSVKPVAEMSNMEVHQVIIGSCSNGRFDDLRIAADIMKGKSVHPDVRMIIIPSSKLVYLEALKKGLIRAFIEAGAVVLNPVCTSNSSINLIAPGERCLTTGGYSCSESAESDTFIVSPATAAASALRGVITDPSTLIN